MTESENTLVRWLKQFKSRSALSKKYPRVYLNLLDKYEYLLNLGLPSHKKKWTKEECIEIAKKYGTIREWDQNCPKSLQCARKKGWLADCTRHMKKLRHYRTLQECIDIAKKYKNTRDWEKEDRNSLAFVRRNGWLQICTAHMENLKKNWSFKECLAEAKKYQRKIDWKDRHPKTYSFALRRGWMDKCSKHMQSWYYDLDKCRQSALKFKTRSDWLKNDRGAYEAAARNKWLDICCQHMKIINGVKKKVLRSDGKIFDSGAEAARSVGAAANNAVSTAIRQKTSLYGYTFKYLEE